MRILLVHSGFAFSSGEIGSAIAKALRRQGHWLAEYDTYRSLEMAKQWLHTRYLYTKQPYSTAEVTELTSGFITNYCLSDDINTVLCIHGIHINPAHINILNKLNITTALWILDDPHEFDLNQERARYYKLIFTNDMNTVDKYERPAYYVPTAVDPEIFKPSMHSGKARYDVLVYGSFYPERLSFLSKLVSIKSCYSIKGFGNTKHEIKGIEWINKPYMWESLIPHLCDSYIILDMVRNPFRSAYGATNNGGIVPKNLNPRIYEALACKRLPITNCDFDLLAEVFGEEAAEKIHYTTVEEADELIKYYLKHPFDYYELVYQLHDIVMEKHTYDNRAEVITEKLQEAAPRPISRRARIVEATRRALTPLWNKNYESNKSIICSKTSIKSFENRYKNKVGIIVSNGPGLINIIGNPNEEAALEIFKYNGVPIVAVNSAYKELSNALFQPEYLMIIDPKEDQAKHFEKCKTENSKLIASYLVSPKMLKEWKGAVYFFSTAPANDKDKPSADLVRLSPGLTVIFSALQFLLYTGCNTIVFVGCDLAYTDNMDYYNIPLTKDSVKDKYKEFIVEFDVNGELTITTPVMLETRNLIREEVKKHKNVTFINATGSGIIHGENIQLMSLERILEEKYANYRK